MNNPTDAKSSPQLMDSCLGFALDYFSNNSSVQLLRNVQLNCSIEQVQAIDNGLKNNEKWRANGQLAMRDLCREL